MKKDPNTLGGRPLDEQARAASSLQHIGDPVDRLNSAEPSRPQDDFNELLRKPRSGYGYKSTKTYTHSQGLSCNFRQWRATHSHCQYIHGYAIQVKVIFGCKELDERNWVQDFGGLKDLKSWLQATFDHKTLVAIDDPKISIYRELAIAKLIQLKEVQGTGCEAFARMIFDWIRASAILPSRVWVESVEVSEHEGNSAIYGRLPPASEDIVKAAVEAVVTRTRLGRLS